MNHENDVGYYRRREAAARELAAGSSDQSIKRIHTQMAEIYAAKVSEAVKPPVLKVVR